VFEPSGDKSTNDQRYATGRPDEVFHRDTNEVELELDLVGEKKYVLLVVLEFQLTYLRNMSPTLKVECVLSR
jgi:hypothetical protein